MKFSITTRGVSMLAANIILFVLLGSASSLDAETVISSPEKTRDLFLHDIIDVRWRFSGQRGLYAIIKYRDDYHGRGFGKTSDTTTVAFPQVFRKGSALYAKTQNGTIRVGTARADNALATLTGGFKLKWKDHEYHLTAQLVR